MSNSNGLTKRRIEQAHTDSKEIWLIDSTPERGGGRLLLRVHRSGSKNFYFRYFLAGKSHVIPMGPYATCTSRFHAQDLRRTAETRMAELGVSKDTRAQIQSHGLGGVQTRHYDMYDYLPEKRVALERWQAYLENCAETSRPPKPHADK
jgi:hypothetical protein